jgi:predicted alpha/beta-fold hydrolase
LRDYRAPAWLPGGHAQTIWPALFSHTGREPCYRRERWTAPDGDFIDVDFQGPGRDGALDAQAPWLVLFHGLEGSSRGSYALAFADVAHRHGWNYAVPHFRGCSGEMNLAPRAYHSGDFEEIGWLLAGLRARSAAPVMAVGISLGGDTAAATARTVASVCSPLDLMASGEAIGSGLNRQVYTRMFLRTMKPRALAKWAQHPGLFDRDRLIAARDLREFDEVFTGPLHGFKGTDDYWSRASAKPHLSRIRIPALALNARNDPFIPAWSLPVRGLPQFHMRTHLPTHGGHVGFPAGAPPGHVLAMPQAVAAWLAQ